MSLLKVHKVISALPSSLEADSIYIVRVGAGFDMYVTDTTGAIAYASNSGGGGGAPQTVKRIAVQTNFGTTVTGTTTSTITSSVLIPANTIPESCILDLSWMTDRPIGGNTSTTRVYINTSNSLSGAVLLATGQVTTTNITGRHIRQLAIVSNNWRVASPTALLTSDLSYAAAQLTTFNLAVNQDLYLIFAIQNANTTLQARNSYASMIAYE